MHGGKSYRGIASPRYKHGRYSKQWLTRFMAMLRDEPEKAKAETDRLLAELAAEPFDVESLINQPNPLEDWEWDPAVLEALDFPLEWDPAVLAALDLPEEG
jgi:hypothetical protein